MSLNIAKPIAFFDLETTGINVAVDRIVEISILKVNADGSKETLTERMNPGIPIPKEASEVHGIYDKDVADKPTFKERAEDIAVFLGDSDLAGFNSNRFDVPLLAEEFLRVGVDFNINGRKMVDVQSIFHQMEQRNLAAAYKFYCGKDLENAHSAEADITATYEVLLEQINRYDNLENDIDFLHDFSVRHRNADLVGRIVFNGDDKEIFNFGKHKGKTVEDVLKSEPSYYHWMMKGDFPLYTKKVLSDIRERMLEIM